MISSSSPWVWCRFHTLASFRTPWSRSRSAWRMRGTAEATRAGREGSREYGEADYFGELAVLFEGRCKDGSKPIIHLEAFRSLSSTAGSRAHWWLEQRTSMQPVFIFDTCGGLIMMMLTFLMMMVIFMMIMFLMMMMMMMMMMMI